MVSEQKTNRKRGKEFVSHIRNHTLVSKQMIKPVLSPPMNTAGVKKTLGLLVKQGILDTRKAHGKLFYEIAQDLEGRKKAAKFFDCHPDELIRPKVRTADLLHHEMCEYWIWTIKREFEDAIVIRDSEIDDSELAQNILLNMGEEREVYPDFLVIFPETKEYKMNSIAFEIERTRKSDQRVLNKLKKYATATRIDGLVYICDSARLSETVRRLYEKTLLKNRLRIGHYSDFFFLFSNAIVPEIEPLKHIFNARGQRIDLFHWVVRLLCYERNFRRNHLFADLVPGAQQNSTSTDA